MSEFIIFLVMVGVFIAGCFLFRLTVAISLVSASVLGMLISGVGFDVRHLVEGMFGYLDTIMVIACAMIFMKLLQDAGTMEAFRNHTIKIFHKHPNWMIFFMSVIAMFPGMITGSSTAAVLSGGGLVAPVMIAMGIPVVNVGALIAFAGILGMLAPPVNIPVMILGGGVDLPYVGFALPLLALSVPLLIFCSLFYTKRHVKGFDVNTIAKEIGLDKKIDLRVYLPLLFFACLMLAQKIFPKHFPGLGLSLTFLLSAASAYFVNRKIDLKKTLLTAIADVLPVLAILAGVGMFVQVMTLTGVRGWIVVSCLELSRGLQYVAMGTVIPLFGAVSSFGAASVLGVPFLLSFISQNQIVTASALSLIAGLGDLMPPTALAGIFAARVVGMPNYLPILKKCIIPSLLVVLLSLLFIFFANPIASVLLGG